MTGVELSYLRRAVESLTASTDVAAEGEGVRVAVFGRKRRLSRQRIVVEPGRLYGSDHPHYPGLIVVANRRFALVIATNGGIIDADDLPAPERAVELAGSEPGTPGVFGPTDNRVHAWHVFDAPRGLILPLAHELCGYGFRGLCDLPTVVALAVAIPVVAGWDEEGRPVYRVRPPVSVADVAPAMEVEA